MKEVYESKQPNLSNAQETGQYTLDEKGVYQRVNSKDGKPYSSYFTVDKDGNQQQVKSPYKLDETKKDYFSLEGKENPPSVLGEQWSERYNANPKERKIISEQHNEAMEGYEHQGSSTVHTTESLSGPNDPFYRDKNR